MSILYFLKPQYESPGVKRTYPEFVAAKKGLKKIQNKRPIIEPEEVILPDLDFMISSRLKERAREDEDLMILTLMNEGIL